MEHIRTFAEKMIIVRRYLGLVDDLDFMYHKDGWFLEAASLYCEAVTNLIHNLNETDPRSQGLLLFREYLAQYIDSHTFQVLQREAQKVKHELSKAKYCVIIQGSNFSVRKL